MARYIRHEVLNQPDDFVQYMMNDFLAKHGFEYVNFKGQMVFRSGGGWFEMPKFLVWSYQNGVFHLEAWIRMLVLPGVYSGENSMTGFYGAIPKKVYKDDLEQLMGLLHQPVGNTPQNMGQTAAGQMPEGQIPQGNGPIIVQGVDTIRYANLALGFGIAGLVLSWTYLGLVLGILTLVYVVKGLSSSKKGRAVAGMVCAILAILIWVGLLIISAL